MAGYQLDRVQNGLVPTDWKPVPTVGVGVKEIRIKDDKNIFRVFYVVETKKGVYVLHAFQQKTRQTELKDIRLAKRRYKEVKRAE
jgi:phage-related protein